MTTMTERSKYLSYLLRHKPEAANLTLDREGWCDLSQLISNTDFTIQEIEDIVKQDSKTRYALKYWEMSDDGIPTSVEPTHIRANQGHSTSSVRIAFKKAIPPTVLYHGADESVLHLILKKGLLPMNRHHVHLSADIETANQVGGRRKNGFVVLEINTKDMLLDGHKFFVSDNGVWLSEHVPPKYIKELS